MTVDEWLESGRYLPAPLKDFHDAKSVFKTMHSRIKEDPSALIKRPSWVEGQCYVIDTFLWFMARRGYTLQRSRAAMQFRDLDADVQESEEMEMQALSALFSKATQVDQTKA